MKNLKLPIFAISIISIHACTTKPNVATPCNDIFETPKVIQHPTNTPLENLLMDTMSFANYWIVEKYRFNDEIYYRKHPHTKYIKFKSDMVAESMLTQLLDTTNNHGFQIITDYTTTLYDYYGDDLTPYACFPVFIVNPTQSTKVFVAKDSYVFAIQEAMDPHNEQWYPIEFLPYDFCGNGYYGIKVHPKEFVMIVAPKFQGDTKGMLRIRLKIGEDIYVSQPYEGYFNSGQFVPPYFLQKRIDDPERLKYGIVRDFIGAVPKVVN